MERVNVYDFDKTIFDGDTEYDFISFLLTKKVLSKDTHNYFLNLINGEIHTFYATVKTSYPLLLELNNLDELIEEFWDLNFSRIKQFYWLIKRDNDIISSATPKLLLKPVIRRLNPVRFLTTELFDYEEQKYELKFLNRRENKVIYLKQQFPNIEIINFYSDSDNDLPLARLAETAFKVTGDKIEEWKVNA